MKTIGAIAILTILFTTGCGYNSFHERRSEIRHAREDFRRAGWEARDEMQRTRRELQRDMQRELREAREEFRREMRDAHRDLRDEFGRW